MEVKASLTTKRLIGFLDLPPEIHHQIYQHCLVRKEPIDIRKMYISGSTVSGLGICTEEMSLLLVSRVVGFEALGALYGDNVFKVYLHSEGESSLKMRFMEANLRRMRKIQIVIPLLSASHGLTPDPTLWSPLLARLRKLSIVAQLPAQKPRRARKYFDVSEQEMKMWMERLETTLRYIAGQLPSSCAVEVDDNDREETSTLIRECLPSGYRKVQTLTGDLWFRRNDYSKKSGYWDWEHG
ncbi:MAG: hypothetical protein M1839_001966 [Geoglossum umbratile]|nr:MAG: hypothetical protein M1839_001966 [Geoglossum umbratile]